ncbi:MAG: hypothetical protein AAFX85_04135 [Pseudomonadota bacterium]
MPLPDTLLAPLEALLNRRIAAASPALDLLEDLDARTLVIDPEEAPAIAFTVIEGRLRLSFDIGEHPNAIVSGALLELTRFAQAGNLEAAREVNVNVQGDVRTAGGYASLLAIARPDFEEELSRLVGDVPAHQLGSAVRGVGDWLARAGSTLQRDFGEFLQEESRDVPPREEVQRFDERLRALDERLANLRSRVDAMSRR